MEPILLIIKYLFKKKNIDNNDESIATFFSNGQSFPDFISLIFDVDTIPGIKKNPTSLFQKKINNTNALQFLFQKNQKIKMVSPSCENEADQIYLLRLILTMQCFTSNSNQILEKSNSIMEKAGYQIYKKNDIFSFKFLSSLLNIVTDGSLPISDNLSEIIQNWDNLKINCPIFVNENSLKSQNSFIFLIQIQVIFDFFSEKIDQILKKESIAKSTPEINIEKEENPTQNDISQLQNQNNENTNNKEKQSSNFQDKSKSTEKIEEEQSPKITTDLNFQKNINDNTNQANTDKPRKLSSAFQDKLNIFNNEQNVESNNNEKVPSMSNLPLNTELDKQKEDNDQSQSSGNKIRKISSAFQDKLNIFNNEQNVESKSNEKVPSMSNIPLNQESDKQIENNDQNESDNNKLRKLSSSFKDKLNIFNSNESNNESHKTHFSPDIQNESSNFNDDKESLSDSDTRKDSIDQLKNEKIRRMSTLLRYELNLFDDENDNENSTESNFNTSVDEIQPSIAHQPPPPPTKARNQQADNKISQLFGNIFKSTKNTDNTNNSIELPGIDAIQKLLNESDAKNMTTSSDTEKIRVMAEVWNPPTPELIFDDGVLYEDKSASRSDKPEIQTQIKSSNGTKSKVRLYNNFFQIFKYDEANYNWYFCELNFDQMIMKLNPNKITPLILFVDSKTEDVLEFVKYFKNEFNFSDEESISVFAFQKKPTNNFLDSINNDFQYDEPFFMFVHVPLYKQNDPQIGTILYQIYTFLYMIADLNIVIFDKKHKMDQILFIKKLISITKIYTENKEKLFREESDVMFLYKAKPKKDDKEKQETKDGENEQNIETSKQQEKDIQKEKEAQIEYEKKIQNKIKKLQNKIEAHILKFQLKSIKYASEFTEIFDETPLNQCNRFSDVKRLMNIANSFFSQINGIYLQLRSKKNIYSELTDITNQMLSLVEGNTLETKIDNVRSEARAFYPPNDDKFSRFIDLVLINLLIELSDEIPKTISNELKNKSNILLASLEKKINEYKHLTEIQMSLIEKGHIYNLKKEFFHIIGEISQYKYVELYYEKKLNILNKQIIDDKLQIQQYFNRFRANLNKKETVIEQKYDESVKKGTNYVMREVQKTREIEVIVAEDGDINTEIEPDF